MIRPVTMQTGFALLPCSVLLVVVLMALSAAVRSSRLQQDAMQAAADLHLARVSANASLSDAEHHLREIFQAVPGLEEGSAPEQYAASACTGSEEQRGHYQLNLLSSDEHTALCRITATGAVRSVSMSVQADFELAYCEAGTALVTPTGQAAQNAPAQANEAATSSCKRGVRLLSWRMMGEA
jgi:Tfp pilus assembly protein PilX